MGFSEEDKRRLFDFYNPAIELFGPEEARSLRWSEKKQQQKRFEALAAVGKLEGASVLDVGCGFGDLYGFLTGRLTHIDYFGIDINLEMVRVAQEKFPDASFEVADFGAWRGEPRDYCLASGAFSFKIAKHRDVYLAYIRKLFEYSRVAAAFNLLDARYHIDNDTFAAYDPEEIYSFCFGLTEKLYLNDQYLPQDFTVYLYK